MDGEIQDCFTNTSQDALNDFLLQKKLIDLSLNLQPARSSILTAKSIITFYEKTTSLENLSDNTTGNMKGTNHRHKCPFP